MATVTADNIIARANIPALPLDNITHTTRAIAHVVCADIENGVHVPDMLEASLLGEPVTVKVGNDALRKDMKIVRVTMPDGSMNTTYTAFATPPVSV